MLQKFKAWLKENHLEWIDEKPEFGDRTIQVQLTLLENETDLEVKVCDRQTAILKADELRTRLLETYGEFPDSVDLLREDRSR
ncbi:hypothetical protein NIES2119_04870 [[Phormidium ambiguum] IAM M-71]|uniref:Uncharacterized protein n=1 Tax=[Phormidium ambiguum] IAM M-71 TaxID=454136 RepID=A0A1U7IQ97_9CYAN|nr:hypothetical protein [Phormidium ambiguum]OKH39611.1 hypothetical protein NIES2119_04870 [Phormidium ambiguum IAM M-71]